ncbi:MAG: hypothetical protein LBL39_01940 [Planctomycetaceae bacterium]|jgi:hypothetical protein|nr:hypothetical protein [Planctomycetaceae bacterium]
MAVNLQKGIIQEALKIGKARGKARRLAIEEERGRLKGMIESILDILSYKFGQVPQHIVDPLKELKDEIAIKSLVLRAVHCSSLNDFVADL